MVFKSLHIELHALFLNEKVLTVHNVVYGLLYLIAFNSLSFCDNSKLFRVFEWSVNCILESCYFDLKIQIAIYKKKKLYNKISMIL